MPVLLVSESDFEKEVLRSELPVLVDLYADWCAPCKDMAPILEQLSTELEGALKIVRVDVESSPALARGFRVRSIPMLVLISGGRPVDQVVGAVDKKAIMALLKPVLPRSSNELEPAELAELLAQRRVVPVDVRDPSAYGRYRIPGALSLPATAIMDRLSELRETDGRLPVLYSRSTDEAKELSEKIISQGVEVAYLKGGFLHWEADGLEVERGG